MRTLAHRATEMLPSLGYQESTTLRKSEVARLQLAEAISLFTAEKFLPAVTLAGAAEEILGKLLNRKEELSAIKESAKVIENLRRETGLPLMGGKSEKEMIDVWNAARNSLKHLVGPEDEPITVNLCDEAYWMIRRALENAKRLQLSIPNEQEFENWVVININS